MAGGIDRLPVSGPFLERTISRFRRPLVLGGILPLVMDDAQNSGFAEKEWTKRFYLAMLFYQNYVRYARTFTKINAARVRPSTIGLAAFLKIVCPNRAVQCLFPDRESDEHGSFTRTPSR